MSYFPWNNCYGCHVKIFDKWDFSDNSRWLQRIGPSAKRRIFPFLFPVLPCMFAFPLADLKAALDLRDAHWHRGRSGFLHVQPPDVTLSCQSDTLCLAFPPWLSHTHLCLDYKGAAHTRLISLTPIEAPNWKMLRKTGKDSVHWLWFRKLIH